MKYNLLVICVFAVTLKVVAQPKLVGGLSFNAAQHGGSIFRVDLPASSQSIIHTFNNLAPHRPTTGLGAGNDDWLYGFLTFNGTSNDGGLYRIKKDGSGFTLLYNLTENSYSIPYYHTDGFVYFNELFQIKRYNPANSTVTDVGLGGAEKTMLIDAGNWIYSTNGFMLSKIKTDGTDGATLHTFNAPTDGAYGYAGLTESPGDTIWGTNLSGGTSDLGTLYSIKKDGSGFHVHFHFNGADGSYPESKPIYFDGKIYGTTTQGGNHGFGVLYVINKDGTGYRVIHHFEPGSSFIGTIYGNISIAANGRIFGTFHQHYSEAGYPYRFFKVDTSGSNYEVMGSMITYNQYDFGNMHQDILLTDNDESIFVVTQEMGRHDGGVVSQFDTLGNGIEMHHFGYSANGFRPVGGLVKGSTGKLFGTAQFGGTDGNGVIFSINQNGTGFSKLHEFTDADGRELKGNLLEASDGKLYGAAFRGGATNTGTLYRIDKNGMNFEVIYSFQVFADGYAPNGSLKEDASGMLFGTTQFSSGNGVVFKINKDGTNYSVLKNFGGVNSLSYPLAGVTLLGNYVYGVCAYGGPDNKGGVFRVSKDGTVYEELRVFSGSTDANSPRSALYLASNAKLYGTTSFGGINNEGTIFRIDTSGSNYSVLKSFSSTTDGAYPDGGLIQASDLLLYGTANYGGTAGNYSGTLYRLNLDGSVFNLLHSFNDFGEGTAPTSILDLNGNFVLPVELLSFNADKRGQAVLLTWKTAQEQNSDRFNIERSQDGITFTIIGTVAAAGNTNTITNYSFTDNDPMNGINYYRLKQTDIDRSFTYSKSVSVNFDANERLVVFPNPASDRLYIRLPQGSSYTAIRVFDASGKIVLQKNINSSAIAELNVQALAIGWYVIQLVGENKLEKVFLKE